MSYLSHGSDSIGSSPRPGGPVQGFPPGGRDAVASRGPELLRQIAYPMGTIGAGSPKAPASALVEEAGALNEVTGDKPPMFTSLVLAAWRGQETRAVQLIAASIEDVTVDDADRTLCLAEYAAAVLYNGLGHCRAAFAAAERACAHRDVGLLAWALIELVEAGVRSGSPDVAADALRRLEDRTPADGTDWVRGIRARSRALLSDRDAADGLYREAIERFARSRIVPHLARAQLVYGEWLRRQGRRVEARMQLRAAHGTFSHLGADGFAQRAGRELLATGETARKRTVDTRDELTPQEAQIARLASLGDTNTEIGAQLFISPRTVEWHLKKVFTKLGISSRKQLRGAVPGTGRAAVPA
jgi:DNA-binding CsgD family transcriptional regulator